MRAYDEMIEFETCTKCGRAPGIHGRVPRFEAQGLDGSGGVLRWRCPTCGHEILTSTKDYKPQRGEMTVSFGPPPKGSS